MTECVYIATDGTEHILRPGAGTIKPLPDTPEWQGVSSEAVALYGRIQGHLARQMGEAAAMGHLHRSTLMLYAIHVLRHAYHAELPCMSCRSWMPARAVERLTEAAMKKVSPR